MADTSRPNDTLFFEQVTDTLGLSGPVIIALNDVLYSDHDNPESEVCWIKRREISTKDQPCQAVNSDCWLWSQTGVGSLGCYSKSISKYVPWMDCYVKQEVDGMYAAFGQLAQTRGVVVLYLNECITCYDSSALCHLVPVTSFILFSSLSGVWHHLSVSSSDLWGQRRFVHTDLRPWVKCSRTWVTRWVGNSMGLRPPR